MDGHRLHQPTPRCLAISGGSPYRWRLWSRTVRGGQPEDRSRPRKRDLKLDPLDVPHSRGNGNDRHVKHVWRLSVTGDEKTALRSMLATC
jgi:hypothetical protein